MRMRRTREQLGWLAFALLVASAAAAEEPQKWLARVNEALTTLNYDGVFSHWQGGRVETLRIIHRVQGGSVKERLVSLDSSGREFIRTGTELACYLPDQRTVLVEQQPPASLLLGSLPTFDAASAEFYDVKAVRRTRLLGRRVQLIAVTPKDEYRYGYRLWIDEATGTPLRTELCNGQGQPIEQVVFASISWPSRIPDSAFKPDISTDGFTWLREQSGPITVRSAQVIWSAIRLPPGFHLTVRAAQKMPGLADPVDHLVFTDGIASVSVFVELHTHADHVLSGSAQVGSASTFATMIHGHPVTAVGEVPPQTVQFIANSLTEQRSSSSVPAAADPALQQSPQR